MIDFLIVNAIRIMFLSLVGIGATALFFPEWIISFRKKHPFLFWLVFLFCAGMQVMVGVGRLGASLADDGMWRGKMVAHIPLKKIHDVAFATLPLIYLAIFLVSILVQKKRQKMMKVSYATAFLASLVVSPTTFFLCLGFFDKIFVGR